jgi:hypothetical protein
MNDPFDAEPFTTSRIRELVQGLVLRLLAYPGTGLATRPRVPCNGVWAWSRSWFIDVVDQRQDHPSIAVEIDRANKVWSTIKLQHVAQRGMIPSGSVGPAAAISACLALDADDRLMIAGGACSGRTTAIRSLIHSAVTRHSSSDLHLYIVEREASGLSVYESLPHCGGVFGPDGRDRIRRFVTWLGAEVERRQRAWSTQQERPATVLTLIDGWEVFHDPTDAYSVETSMVGVLRQVIKRGPKVGIHLVVTCDRGPLRTKSADLFTIRLVLKFPQVDDVKAFLPQGMPVPTQIPGRAADVSSARSVQIAQPIETGLALVERLTGLASESECLPQEFPALPQTIDLTHLSRAFDAADG